MALYNPSLSERSRPPQSRPWNASSRRQQEQQGQYPVVRPDQEAAEPRYREGASGNFSDETNEPDEVFQRNPSDPASHLSRHWMGHARDGSQGRCHQQKG